MKKVVLCFVVVLLTVSCVYEIKVDVRWSKIQDEPVPLWFVNLCLAKAKTVEVGSSADLARRIIKTYELNTIDDVVDYVRNSYKYIADKEDEWKDLEKFVMDGGGDCEDWSIAIARICDCLGIESFVVIVADIDKNLSHAFVAFKVEDAIVCATPYSVIKNKFDCLKNAVNAVKTIFKYENVIYLSIPIYMIGGE